VPPRIDLGELGAEEEDLRRVVDPYQEQHQRSGRPERRADACSAQVEADPVFPQGESTAVTSAPIQMSFHATGGCASGRYLKMSAKSTVITARETPLFST
jgi:hypothetical protein